MADSIPPPLPTGGPTAGGSVSSNRSIMIVLSYLWLLALVPLVVEKDDREVQWHAKHGIVLMIAEIILYAVVIMLQIVLGAFIGCIFSILFLFVWLGIIVVHIIAILKGINGQRLIIPGVSEYANRF